MKKILVGIFAHPDDEAFGPSGTLYMEAQQGTDVHLITLTAGEAGMNPDSLPDLAVARLAEWRQAGDLIGAQTMHHLGYQDGTLSNLDHLTATEKIMQITEQLTASYDDCEIEFMSMDLNGVTGHIDHIVAARSACLAFYRLRTKGLPMKRIRLVCWPGTGREDVNTDFVFMEAGRKPHEITETVDARQHIETIYQIMRCHHTQRSDGEHHIATHGENVGVNHFITLL